MDEQGKPPMNPILKQLLVGLHDDNSSLFVLLPFPHIFKCIWSQVKRKWKQCIVVYPEPLDYVLPKSTYDEMDLTSFDPAVEYEEAGFVNVRTRTYRREDIFPPFSGISCNMMPFVMSWDFEETLLPENMEGYFEKLIMSSFEHMEDEEFGKIGFLTIHESEVAPHESQRRPGIHTEKGRKVFLTDDGRVVKDHSLGGDAKLTARFISWGEGRWLRKDYRKFNGGIYIATSVENSTRIWNCKVMDCPDGEEIIGDLGDISHLRDLLPSEDQTLEPQKLYWMTDRTPHESLPLPAGGKRQFFRLVTSNVTVWYEDHSTANPNGLTPDPSITTVIRGSKFPWMT